MKGARRTAMGLAVMFLVALSSSAWAGGPRAGGGLQAENAFREVERALLESESLHMATRVTSAGAFESALEGTVALRRGNEAEIEVAGSFGTPVELELRSDGDRLSGGSDGGRFDIATPADLNKAIIVGMTRMGILHTLARLVGGEPPDHMEGGVEEWVRVVDVEQHPESSDGGRAVVRFDFALVVAGESSGTAALWVDAATKLPFRREQTVQFDTGEMTVTELYEFESRPQAAAGATYDHAAPPGANYDVAEFRLWYPDDVTTLRGVVLLVPGSNGDAREATEEATWRQFARRHEFALLGLRVTDKEHEQGFVEHYVDVDKGSGQALLDALVAFAGRSGHPELAEAPWVSWGMSAGGQFNYEMAVWQPHRTIAFILNKGGIYYTAMASEEAQRVPGLLFIGETDMAFRNDIIRGIFSMNRRAGALWALVEEPGVGHAVNRSQELAIMFFDDVIPLRLPANAASDGATQLRPLDPRAGYYGSLETWTFEPVADAARPRVPVAWLPTERLAVAWQKVRRGEPF